MQLEPESSSELPVATSAMLKLVGMRAFIGGWVLSLVCPGRCRGSVDNFGLEADDVVGPLMRELLLRRPLDVMVFARPARSIDVRSSIPESMIRKSKSCVRSSVTRYSWCRGSSCSLPSDNHVYPDNAVSVSPQYYRIARSLRRYSRTSSPLGCVGWQRRDRDSR